MSAVLPDGLEFRLVLHLNRGSMGSSRVDEILYDGEPTGITYGYTTARGGGPYATRELRHGDEVFDLLTGDPADANAWIAERLPS